MARVVCNLLKGITGDPNEELLREEVRGAPVKVEIDAALVLGIGVFEIVGQAGDAREFIPGGWIEVCVAVAGVDRAMAEADIGELRRIIFAGGNITGDV